MFSALMIILILPFSDLGRTKGLQFRPISKVEFYIFTVNFVMLFLLGAKHVEDPYILLGQLCTLYYFCHFIIFVPVISIIENTLIDLATNKE
jgi:quinol-cytochrome oxidoreductase complex cytochrome b subunit